MQAHVVCDFCVPDISFVMRFFSAFCREGAGESTRPAAKALPCRLCSAELDSACKPALCAPCVGPRIFLVLPQHK